MDNLGQEYTIETWINVPVFNAAWSYQYLVEREDVFAFVINSTTGNLEFFRRGPGTNFASTSAVGTGAWHHVAVRRQLTGIATYTTTLLIDGVASGSSTSNDFDLTPGGVKDLTIGNTTFTGFAYLYPLMGKMDDVRIWSVARSDGQILANRGVPLSGGTAGLLAYYKMDEGAGQSAGDATANALNGTLGSTGGADVNDPAWGVSDAPVGFNLIAPNAGILNCGAPLIVNWVANPAVANVNILYSLDAGANWTLLAAGVPNSGTFNTFVPGVATNSGLFRVADPANAAAFDDSDVNLQFNAAAFVPVYLSYEAEGATGNGGKRR